MSSGVEAEIALDAAVIASLGMNRILGASAGVGAKGASILASLADRKAEARAEVLADAERYERALREVVERNARIRTLADTQARALRGHGVRTSIALPAALALTGQAYEELLDWCAAADAALDGAEAQISADIAGLVATRLCAGSDVREDLTRDLTRVLARLLPDTSGPDHEKVYGTAAKVAAAGTPQEAESLLSEVRLQVQQANERVREVRALVRREAAERDRLAQAEAERQYVLATVTHAFEELGYEVDAGFETATAQDGALLLTHDAWPDQAVRMLLDEDAVLRAKMLRTTPPRGEEDRRRDAEREREWCTAFEAAQDRLAQQGLSLDVTWRLEPGAHELPLGAQSSRTRKKERARERRLEY
ncbi:MAG: response regulator receiver protein [Streptosporangiaceae bacterium]